MVEEISCVALENQGRDMISAEADVQMTSAAGAGEPPEGCATRHGLVEALKQQLAEMRQELYELRRGGTTSHSHGSRLEKGSAGQAHHKVRSDTQMPHGYEDCAAVHEIAQVASSELRRFAELPFPRGSPVRVNLVHLAAVLVSPIHRFVPMNAFWTTYNHLGLTWRISMLLIVCRADVGCDGDVESVTGLSGHLETCSNKLVQEASNILGTIQIVATLLIGSTHLTTIGRPKSWAQTIDPQSIDAFGSDGCDYLLFMAYVCNVMAEALALALLLLCIMFRFALGFALTSLHGKLCFLVGKYDPVYYVMYSMLLLLTVFSFIPVFGGILSSPTWGFAALSVPFCFTASLYFCTSLMTFELKELHVESRKLFRID